MGNWAYPGEGTVIFGLAQQTRRSLMHLGLVVVVLSLCLFLFLLFGGKPRRRGGGEESVQRDALVVDNSAGLMIVERGEVGFLRQAGRGRCRRGGRVEGFTGSDTAKRGQAEVRGRLTQRCSRCSRCSG